MLTLSKSCCLSVVADVGILVNHTLEFINKIRPQLNGHYIFVFKQPGHLEDVCEANL